MYTLTNAKGETLHYMQSWHTCRATLLTTGIHSDYLAGVPSWFKAGSAPIVFANGYTLAQG